MATSSVSHCQLPEQQLRHCWDKGCLEPLDNRLDPLERTLVLASVLGFHFGVARKAPPTPRLVAVLTPPSPPAGLLILSAPLPGRV